ncbi:uncharacterized protein LOC125230737 [Leguminivora glycinivorella]|uniref:uncharacterized protein LOC125230737 n=1 Tax=Leguminivora glycinivorella TaxID=1035111 RepID=UPI0020109C80|nr:uncharacterized protein LOC125230737 [Leguminivora glycinivorella]
MIEGKDGELGLQGNIILSAEIEQGTMMNVEIWKMMDIGKEYLYHTQGDICGSLKDKNTPWYPMFEAMKISECPIPVKKYEIKDMIINLEHAKEMLTHEMCGDYVVRMSMTKGNDIAKKMSCQELEVSLMCLQTCGNNKNKTED